MLLLSALAIAGQSSSPSVMPALPVINAAPATPVLSPEAALEECLRKQRASVEKQRQAVHAQLGERVAATPVSTEATNTQFIVPLTNVNQPDCPTIDNVKLDELVSSAAQKQFLDPSILKAVIKQESGFKPCAISPKGAQGLMQLMPATARELHVSDPFDPSQNIHAGAAYLRQLLDRYRGDLRQALIGYNAGPGRADLGNEAILPFETQNYIASVFADLNNADEPNAQLEDLAPAEDDIPSANNSKLTQKATPSNTQAKDSKP